MCGISAIINQNNRPVDAHVIKKMNDLIIHRGPDDEGYFFDTQFAFGHRRLSILDLSSDGHQPMIYQKRYVITYNGEIYNYLEIRNKLLTLGYKFHSDTDTEVVLAAYAEWGKDCVQRFNGMWAFAIYDVQEQIIFCSRDRFGVKPFYYTEINGQFIFASEIKQLLVFYPVRYVNKFVLMDFLVLGLSEHSNETFFEGIKALPASHNLTYQLSNHTYVLQRYYQINFDHSLHTLGEEEAIEDYHNMLHRSIALRLRSDVKIGTCLSGGMDSSTVAGIASKIHNKNSKHPFTAITASSTDKLNDETYYAKLVAEQSKLSWHTITPRSQDFIKQLEKLVRVQEEPFPTPSLFMQYFVFEKAKALGCTVMLDGQGGDETLLGYERYYPSYLLSNSIFSKLKIFWNSGENSKLSKRELLAYIIYFLFPLIRKSRLINQYSFVKQKYMSFVRWQYIEELASAYRDVKTLQKLEIESTQLPHLLRYEDRNSMIHSIESRLPFIDYCVLEKILSLPDRYKIKGGWTKFLLRKSAEKYLPQEVIWRKNKIGFEAPSEQWFIENKSYIEQTISSSSLLKKITIGELNKLSRKILWKLFFRLLELLSLHGIILKLQGDNPVLEIAGGN